MRKEKVLIVEDERIIALDLKKRLERFGFPSPEIVSNGEEALTAAESLRPDIILMDIMLGGPIDGIDAAKQSKKNLISPLSFSPPTPMKIPLTVQKKRNLMDIFSNLSRNESCTPLSILPCISSR